MPSINFRIRWNSKPDLQEPLFPAPTYISIHLTFRGFLFEKTQRFADPCWAGNSAWVCHGNWIFFVPLGFKNLAPVRRPYLYLGHILFLTWHVHAVTGLGTRAARRPHYLVDYDLATNKSTSMETQWVGLRENRWETTNHLWISWPGKIQSEIIENMSYFSVEITSS